MPRFPRRRASFGQLAERGDSARLLKALSSRRGDLLERSDGTLVDVGWERRAQAARHLAGLEGEAVTEGLLGLLSERNVAVRLEALRSLSLRADVADAALIAGLLGWPEEDARRHGAEHLAERARGDGASAQRMVTEYLRLDGFPGLRLPDPWLETVIALIDGPDRGSLLEQAVRRALEAPDASLRARQVLAADEPLAVGVLLAAGGSRDSRIAVTALLGELRNSGATAALLDLLVDPDAGARVAAAEALGRIQDPRAVEGLLRAAADEVFAVRDAAQRALDALGTAGVVWSVAVAARGGLDHAAQLDGHGSGERRQIEAAESPPPAA